MTPWPQSHFICNLSKAQIMTALISYQLKKKKNGKEEEEEKQDGTVTCEIEEYEFFNI